MDYTYESSDPNIVSVDETGGLNAWKAGTATITITAETIGVTKQVTITVDGSQYEDAEVFSKVNLEGAASDNIHLPHYSSYYGSTTKSYLAQTADGGYQRAEYINDKIAEAGLAENKIELGDDEYFVIGDNCNNSEDSRSANIGNIKKEHIIGKAWFKMAAQSSSMGFVN